MNNFNVLVLGKTGVGKSTLVNTVLDLNGKEGQGAKTGTGKPVTQETTEYTSEARPGIRIDDTRGIELGKWGPNEAVDEAKSVVERNAATEDPDKYIHAIWYCVATCSHRFEDVEKETLVKLTEIYDDGRLPVMVVLTQSYFSSDAQELSTAINMACSARKVTITPVLAVEKEQFKPYGIDTLLAETARLSAQASNSAYYHAIKKRAEAEIRKGCEAQARASLENTQKAIEKKDQGNST